MYTKLPVKSKKDINKKLNNLYQTAGRNGPISLGIGLFRVTRNPG